MKPSLPSLRFRLWSCPQRDLWRWRGPRHHFLSPDFPRMMEHPLRPRSLSCLRSTLRLSGFISPAGIATSERGPRPERAWTPPRPALELAHGTKLRAPGAGHVRPPRRYWDGPLRASFGGSGNRSVTAFTLNVRPDLLARIWPKGLKGAGATRSRWWTTAKGATKRCGLADALNWMR